MSDFEGHLSNENSGKLFAPWRDAPGESPGGGMTGTLSTVRATPYYWRVHVFGRNGSAESLGENELMLRRSGAKPEWLSLAPVDSLRAELEAFAGAVTAGDAFPIRAQQMIDTIAAFEAIIQSIGVDAMVQVTQ